VRAFPGPGSKLQVSTEGGFEPVWSRDGSELFYRNGDKMMSVGITTRPVFAAGSPRVLFEAQCRGENSDTVSYDVSPDGRRFLMIKVNEQERRPTQFYVALNWFEELKRQVSEGKKK
jgi:serine/threonine-protein kinase